MGLTALGKLAERLSFRNTDMEITFLYDDDSKKKMFITPDNLMTVEKHEVRHFISSFISILLISCLVFKNTLTSCLHKRDGLK